MCGCWSGDLRVCERVWVALVCVGVTTLVGCGILGVHEGVNVWVCGRGCDGVKCVHLGGCVGEAVRV